MQALIDCGAEFALAHHFGTFQLTDEAIDAPLNALAEALEGAAIAPEQFRTLRPGEVWETLTVRMREGPVIGACNPPRLLKIARQL